MLVLRNSCTNQTQPIYFDQTQPTKTKQNHAGPNQFKHFEKLKINLIIVLFCLFSCGLTKQNHIQLKPNQTQQNYFEQNKQTLTKQNHT